VVGAVCERGPCVGALLLFRGGCTESIGMNTPRELQKRRVELIFIKKDILRKAEDRKSGEGLRSGLQLLTAPADGRNLQSTATKGADRGGWFRRRTRCHNHSS